MPGENGAVSKKACYIVMGIDSNGYKDVLSIELGEAESSKFWLSVFTGLKNRGIQDVLIFCADGLTGIKEAIAAAFPPTSRDYSHGRLSKMH